MDWKEKRVLICGMARSGVSAAQALCNLGAKVTVSDRKTEEELDTDLSLLRSMGCSFLLGSDPGNPAGRFDVVVISPGIPYAAPFVGQSVAAGIPVIGELELGAELTHGDLVAITGTNGKTTTTTLTGEFFPEAGRRTYVVGNIGYPITETALVTNDEDVTVAEVSSYQCESITDFHPRVAAVLNITEDHLARHGSMDVYIGMKKRIFRWQTEEDYAVLNYDDAECRKMAEGIRAKVLWFSRKEKVGAGAYVKDGEVVIAGHEKEPVCRTCEIRIPGSHNLENALAAVAITYSLGVPIPCMRKVLLSFPGVEHRIETVREVDGVVWVNDSKGTNVDSTIKAINAMTRPTVLILGGSDKKVSFVPLAEAIVASPLIRRCVLIGDTAEQIKNALLAAGYKEFRMAGYDFDRCLAICREEAAAGDCVLLSPACASFDMFRDYEDRGQVFKKKVLSFVENSGA